MARCHVNSEDCYILIGLGVSLRFAMGQALVNQARFSVLAIRHPSLTHPAIAGLFQASAIEQTIPHPVTGLLPSLSPLANMKKADPAPLIPTYGRR